MSETNISEDMLVQEAKRYAVNIVRETPLFKNFAVNMIDFAGRNICPYLVEIYKEMSSILFTEGLPQDNLDYVEGLKMDEMLSWYDSYKANLDDWEKRQAEFKENIDELQFLTDEYRKSDEFKKMLDFVGKFNYIAAYNAMLIEMQKPGAQLVLEGRKWIKEYNRCPKPNGQKLITLKQFGPVQCLFDISDTEPINSKDMTEDEEILENWESKLRRIEGNVDPHLLKALTDNLPLYGVYLDISFNATSTLGGYVKPYHHEINVPLNKQHTMRYNSRYLLSVNRMQGDTEKFHTICHELAHIFCRHLTYSKEKVRKLSLKEREFEAETVAWLVCKRHGIKNPSEEYLAVYAPNGEIPICSTDAIMKAVAEIEKMLRDDLRVRQAQWYKEDRNFKDDVDYAFKKLKERKEANKK